MIGGAPKVSDAAEEAILGTIILSPKILEPLLTEARLRPAHFYSGSRKAIYAAMLALHDNGTAIDPVTVHEQLKKGVAGVEYLPDLDEIRALAGSASTTGVRDYALRVVELWRWRQEQNAASEIIEASTDEDRERRDRALAVLMKPDPAHAEVTSSRSDLADMMREHFDAPEDEVFPWPLADLDELTAGGMRRGEVTYIGGWTSHGKSVWLDQIMAHAATLGHTSWLYMNEMTRKQRACRMVSAQTGVGFAKVLRNRMTEMERRKVLAALDAIPFGMTDADGWSAEEVARDARARQLDIVGVDILHNFAHDDESDLRRIAQVMKSLAIQGDMHVLCTVHLNTRRLQQQVSPAPTRGDIRGSGMIANLANNVMFVHREQEEKSGQPLEKSWLYFSKVRNGQVGGTTARFNGKQMRFESPQADAFEHVEPEDDAQGELLGAAA